MPCVRHLSGAWSSLKNAAVVKTAIAAALANDSLAVDALATIGEAGLTQFDQSITHMLGENRKSNHVQLAAIGIASRFRLDAARPQLAALLHSREPPIREAALRRRSQCATKMLTNLLTGLDTPLAVKQQILDLLMLTSDGAVFLLRLIDTEARPAAVRTGCRGGD